MPASLAALNRRIRPYARALIQAMAAAGLQPNVTNTRRSTKTQSDLYNAYRRDPLHNYPAAPPGHSQHQKGLALDVTINDMSKMAAWGAAWKRFGPNFRWGGDFKDPVHFDIKP